MAVKFTGEVHPFADEWPMMSDAELDAMAADIGERGLQKPVVLGKAGQLLDGRNRLAACKRAEVEPRFEVYAVDDVVAFIWSANALRRETTPSQKAMLAAAALPFYEAEAKERQKRKPATDPDSVSATLHGQIGKATEKAAAATGASARNVAKAKKVAEADPELAAKVKAGEVSLNEAEKTVRTNAATVARENGYTRKPGEILADYPKLRGPSNVLTADESYALAEAVAAHMTKKPGDNEKEVVATASLNWRLIGGRRMKKLLTEIQKEAQLRRGFPAAVATDGRHLIEELEELLTTTGTVLAKWREDINK
jgi:ParB-like chromosome segregation protein Spo0J